IVPNEVRVSPYTGYPLFLSKIIISPRISSDKTAPAKVIHSAYCSHTQTTPHTCSGGCCGVWGGPCAYHRRFCIKAPRRKPRPTYQLSQLSSSRYRRGEHCWLLLR